ncbi:MAG: vitamin K epoxide reductase family protein [Planctomycetes bacterium]|nr:vitamin K epoxide reductase family protein [Planctomycetota bacterium]
MDPQALSEVLRTGEGLYLWCRRGMVITSFVAAGCMMFIGLYQMGLIRHLPEPPFRLFNADKVDAAPEAYNRMWLPMPDAFLGLVSYAVTVALVSLGGADRFQRWPWLLVPLLMGLKVVADAVQAGKLSWEQWDLHRAFCFWCLVAALATFVAVPLAAPETWAAIKRAFS